MKLEWNVNYEFVFNKFYPVDLRLVFEIPIFDGSFVYMRHLLIADTESYIVLLDTQKFIRAWRQSTDDYRFPGYHLGNEALWRRDRKFHEAENGFKHGKRNPVPVGTEIYCSGRSPHCQFGFIDGVTRTIWLLANNATYFPVVARNKENADAFQRNAGRDCCAIYPCEGLHDQWFQENVHLLPQAPL